METVQKSTNKQLAEFFRQTPINFKILKTHTNVQETMVFKGVPVYVV